MVTVICVFSASFGTLWKEKQLDELPQGAAVDGAAET
jgi:hypothetical protein